MLFLEHQAGTAYNTEWKNNRIIIRSFFLLVKASTVLLLVAMCFFTIVHFLKLILLVRFTQSSTLEISVPTPCTTLWRVEKKCTHYWYGIYCISLFQCTTHWCHICTRIGKAMQSGSRRIRLPPKLILLVQQLLGLFQRSATTWAYQCQTSTLSYRAFESCHRRLIALRVQTV